MSDSQSSTTISVTYSEASWSPVKTTKHREEEEQTSPSTVSTDSSASFFEEEDEFEQRLIAIESMADDVLGFVCCSQKEEAEEKQKGQDDSDLLAEEALASWLCQAIPCGLFATEEQDQPNEMVNLQETDDDPSPGEPESRQETELSESHMSVDSSLLSSSEGEDDDEEDSWVEYDDRHANPKSSYNNNGLTTILEEDKSEDLSEDQEGGEFPLLGSQTRAKMSSPINPGKEVGSGFKADTRNGLAIACSNANIDQSIPCALNRPLNERHSLQEFASTRYEIQTRKKK
eukprot:scaffold184_cov125-Cylindrotheca_fusiformis.AAC.15